MGGGRGKVDLPNNTFVVVTQEGNMSHTILKQGSESDEQKGFEPGGDTVTSGKEKFKKAFEQSGKEREGIGFVAGAEGEGRSQDSWGKYNGFAPSSGEDSRESSDQKGCR